MGTFSRRVQEWGTFGDSSMHQTRKRGCVIVPSFFSVFFVFKGPFAFVNGQTSSSLFIKNSMFIRVCRFSPISLSLMPFLVRSGRGAGKYGIRVTCVFFAVPCLFLFETAFLSQVWEGNLGGRGYVVKVEQKENIQHAYGSLYLCCGVLVMFSVFCSGLTEEFCLLL